MTGGSHIHLDKYLGVAWADRPPPQSGLSVRQVLHNRKIPHPILTLCLTSTVT